MKKSICQPILTRTGTASAGSCIAGIMTFPMQTQGFAGQIRKGKDKTFREPVRKHNAAVRSSFPTVLNDKIKTVGNVSGSVCVTQSLSCYGELLTENNKQKAFGKVWSAFDLDKTKVFSSDPTANVTRKIAARTAAAYKTILESSVSRLPLYVLEGPDASFPERKGEPGEADFSTGLENERCESLVYGDFITSHFRLINRERKSVGDHWCRGETVHADQMQNKKAVFGRQPDPEC